MSLVETMVAIAILGIAVLTIVSGLGVAARGSTQHRGEADAEVALRSAGEVIKRQNYIACPSTAVYDLSGARSPAGIDVSLASIERWNGAAFQSECPTEDGGLQRITLRALADDGRLSRDLQVVKRR